MLNRFTQRLFAQCLCFLLPSIPLHAGVIETRDLTVLSLNVAGLPWPVMTERRLALEQIGAQIALLSKAGPAIDIVLVQEGFNDGVLNLKESLGFAEHVAGPARALRHNLGKTETSDVSRKWWKGEGVGTWLGSGLHIFSAHPIIGIKRHAFGSAACAGYDCLANKGALMARVLIPTLPTPIDVITTHLNSTRSAQVPEIETHKAHQRQTAQLAGFWRNSTVAEFPTILAGDLNVRNSHERFIPLAKQFKEATFVKNECALNPVTVDCHLQLHTHTPWLSSQDIHAYKSGTKVRISVLEARSVLNEPINGKKLSDHDGYLVRYQLIWVSEPAIETLALKFNRNGEFIPASARP
ncbi:MAG: hypothetical protein RIC29_16085 [Rhodospirillaceae bacterium]